VVRPCYTGPEPGSFHHTIRTSVEDMVATQHKWWRWIGEESLSGGVIGLWEGGNTFPCGVRRPSQHSMMRWLGFYFDQVGREKHDVPHHRSPERERHVARPHAAR
jgi:hypothetical protein